jgi:hypothetical protein
VADSGCKVAFARFDRRYRQQLPLPEGLGRRPLRLCGSDRAAAVEEGLELRAAHPHAPTDVQRGQRPLTPDRLLVQLTIPGDLGDVRNSSTLVLTGR